MPCHHHRGCYHSSLARPPHTPVDFRHSVSVLAFEKRAAAKNELNRS